MLRLVSPDVSRQLHNTHWGLVCPAETPEGQVHGQESRESLVRLNAIYVDMLMFSPRFDVKTSMQHHM